MADVQGKGSWKEEFLAFVFVLVFLSPLAYVGYVDANWETTTTEQVWVSDANAINPHEEYEDIGTLTTIEGNFTTSYRIANPLSTDYYLNDSTPLYANNNTWVASWENTGVLTTPANFMMHIFEIPDADTFLINEIDYRLFYGVGSTPDTVNIFISIWEIDGEMDTGVNNPDEDNLATHNADILVPTSAWDNGTAEIQLAQALDIYEKASIPNAKVFIQIQILDANGWSLHDTSVKLQINGTRQSGLSASDLVYYGLGFSTFVNIIVGLFMTDQIDIATVKKALGRK